MLRIIEFKSSASARSNSSDDDGTISSRTESYYSVGSDLSRMLEDPSHNIHVIPQDSELNAIFGIFPVNQNTASASQALEEQIKKALAQRNLGGWLFKFTKENNNLSLNDVPQLESSSKRLAFAKVIAKSWTSLVVTSEMRADEIARISAQGATIINEKQNENFEIYVSEHNIDDKKEYSIIYYQINHDTVQNVHPGVFLCKIDQWMHPILQMMMIRLTELPPNPSATFYCFTPTPMRGSQVASPAYRFQFATNMQHNIVSKLFYALNLQNPLFCFDCMACDIIFEAIDKYFWYDDPLHDTQWIQNKDGSKIPESVNVNWKDYSYYTENLIATPKEIKDAGKTSRIGQVLVRREPRQVLLSYTKMHHSTEVNVYYFISNENYRKFRIEIKNLSANEGDNEPVHTPQLQRDYSNSSDISHYTQGSYSDGGRPNIRTSSPRFGRSEFGSDIETPIEDDESDLYAQDPESVYWETKHSSTDEAWILKEKLQTMGVGSVEFDENVYPMLRENSYGFLIFKQDDILVNNPVLNTEAKRQEFCQLIATSWHSRTGSPEAVAFFSKLVEGDIGTRKHEIYCFKRTVNGRGEYSIIFVQLQRIGNNSPGVFLFKIDAKTIVKQKQMLLDTLLLTPIAERIHHSPFSQISNIGPFYRFKFASDLENNNVFRVTDPLSLISLDQTLTVTTRACDIVLEMIKSVLGGGSEWTVLDNYRSGGWSPSDTRVESEYDFIEPEYDDDETPITEAESRQCSRDVGLGKIQGRRGNQYNVMKTVMISNGSRIMHNLQRELVDFKTTVCVYYFISNLDGSKGNRMMRIEYKNELI